MGIGSQEERLRISHILVRIEKSEGCAFRGNVVGGRKNGTYEADGKLPGDIHNILSRDKGDCLLCLFDDVSTIAVRSNCCRRSDCIDFLSDAADVPLYNGCLSPRIISEGDTQQLVGRDVSPRIAEKIGDDL